jgi:hypothetical protein
VPWRAPADERAVAEEVVAVLAVLEQRPRHARLVVVGRDVGGALPALGVVGGVVLRPRDEHLGVRQPVDHGQRARVVEVQVALDDPADARGIHADALELGQHRLVGAHEDGRALREVAPVLDRVLGDLGRVAAVDDHVASRVREHVPRRGVVDALLAERVARVHDVAWDADDPALEKVQPDVVRHRTPPPGSGPVRLS